jgi:hypothetical protein
MLYAILASVAQFVRDLATEGQQANLDLRRDRGDKMGQANYGMRLVARRYVDDDGHERVRIDEERDPDVDIEPLRQALLDAGESGVMGAVRLLNEQGVRAPRGKIWYQSAYRRALNYHFPGLITETARSRPNRKSSMLLTGLLKCHCGQTLTPNQARGQFYCYRSRMDPEGHAGRRRGKGRRKGSVKEALLLPWVREEAARMRIPYEQVRLAAERDTERDKLHDRLEKLSRQHEMGVLTDEQLSERVADIRVGLDRLEAAAAAVLVMPDIDWEGWSTEAINRNLRGQFEYIQLDDKLRPVRAKWTMPEWRAE